MVCLILYQLKQKIMKKLSFILILLIGIFATSCKEECPAPTFPVEGHWVGKYGSGEDEPTSGFSMVVETGGKVTVADGDNITSSSKASGTWTLTGNVFKATYTYPGGGINTIQANWTNDGKMADGTWGSGSSPTGSGTWFMNRTN